MRIGDRERDRGWGRANRVEEWLPTCTVLLCSSVLPHTRTPARITHAEAPDDERQERRRTESGERNGRSEAWPCGVRPAVPLSVGIGYA